MKFFLAPIKQSWSDIKNKENWKKFFIFMIVVCGISSLTGFTIYQVIAGIVGVIVVLVFLNLAVWWIFFEKEDRDEAN